MPAEQLHKTTVEDLTRGFKQGGEWHRELAGQALAIKQGRAQVNDAAGYEDLVAKIDQYRPDQAEAPLWKERLSIEMGVKFTGADLQKLQDRLEKRRKAGSDAVDMGQVTSQLAKWKEQGRLGVYQYRTPDNSGKLPPGPGVDQKALAKVTARQRAIRETLDDEVRRNVLKTSEEAVWRLAELVMRQG